MTRVCWDELTGPELIDAAGASGGVCLLPIGCLEKHAEHLPCGTDSLVAHRLSVEVARRESAVVFPPLHAGVVGTIRNHAGVVAAPADLLLRLWENTCDEISRNGFHKIVLVNYHGGNRYLCGLLVQHCLTARKDYALYYPQRLLDQEVVDRVCQSAETQYGCHGGESETSIVLHLWPELVRADRIGALDGRPRAGPDLGADVYYSANWFSRHPTHYAGDARAATAAKGKALFEAMAAKLAETVGKIKRDGCVADLLAEYYRQTERFRGRGD